MPKSKYLNFAEYEANDKDYFLNKLADKLHLPQKKIEFRDGSTYHVTRSGSRYWEKNGRMHREDGPAAIYPGGRGYYYLFSTEFDEQGHSKAVRQLETLREVTEDEIENIMAVITSNIPWEMARDLWRKVLTDKDIDPMLEELLDFYEMYADLTSGMLAFLEIENEE